jgi:hypothetical protein
MAFQLQFPARETKKTVVTPLMERTAKRTLAVHAGGALVVWTGPSRNGKTWTAQWMVDQLAEGYATSMDAFHARHFEMGEIDSGWGGGDQKRAIRALYHATIGKLDESTYRMAPVSDLARLTALALQTKNIQMVFVDEAGLLSLSAIRGLVLLRDTAENEDWPLSIVLIGMDDLPTKLRETDQVWNRIHEWCYFKPYDLTDTHRFLAELHPHFAALDPQVPSDAEQLRFVHDTYGGLPGMFTPYVRRLRSMASEMDREIDLLFLKAAHLRTQRDEQNAMSDATSRNGVVSLRGPKRARGGNGSNERKQG